MQKSLTRIYYTMSQLKAKCINEDFAAKRKKDTELLLQNGRT